MARQRVDWTELHKELLCRISQMLDSPFYLIRFRSVCTSWSSSSSPIPIPNHLNLHRPSPLKIPILSTKPTPTTTTRSTFSLTRYTILLISPPNPSLQNPNPWLVKMTQDPQGQTHLFNPLTNSLLKPTHSPHHLLDLNNLPVLDLANGVTVEDTLHFRKPLLKWLGPRNDAFAILAIHASGSLALFRTDAPHWTLHSNPDGAPYDDICIHKGSFYAIDREARVVTVGPDWTFEEVGEPVCCGDRTYMLSSLGDLLLVDKFFPEDDDYSGVGADAAFNIYRLKESKQRWVQVDSLGDTVVFLGDDCSFSAEATSELGHDYMHNSLVFRDDMPGEPCGERGLLVYHVSSEMIAPLSAYPELAKLFWPPPDWVGFSLTQCCNCILTVMLNHSDCTYDVHQPTLLSLHLVEDTRANNEDVEPSNKSSCADQIHFNIFSGYSYFRTLCIYYAIIYFYKYRGVNKCRIHNFIPRCMILTLLAINILQFFLRFASAHVLSDKCLCRPNSRSWIQTLALSTLLIEVPRFGKAM